MKKKTSLDFEKPFIAALAVIIFVCWAIFIFSDFNQRSMFVDDPTTLTASPK